MRLSIALLCHVLWLGLLTAPGAQAALVSKSHGTEGEGLYVSFAITRVRINNPVTNQWEVSFSVATSSLGYVVLRYVDGVLLSNETLGSGGGPTVEGKLLLQGGHVYGFKADELSAGPAWPPLHLGPDDPPPPLPLVQIVLPNISSNSTENVRNNGSATTLGQARNLEVMVSDPVNVVSGALQIDTVDYTSPGAVPIVIRRSYSNQGDSHDVLGRNWRLNYTNGIERQDYMEGEDDKVRVKVIEPDGTLMVYTGAKVDDVLSGLTFDDAENAGLLEAGGMTAYEAQHSNITVDGANYTLHRFDGSREVYTANATWGDPSDWLFLTSRFDPQGNEIKVTYHDGVGAGLSWKKGLVDTITSCCGDVVQFKYGDADPTPRGYLKSISVDRGEDTGTFYHNEFLIYTVDQFGNLVTVTGEDYCTWNYAYETQVSADLTEAEGMLTANITSYEATPVIRRIEVQDTDQPNFPGQPNVLEIYYDEALQRVTDQWETKTTTNSVPIAHYDYVLPGGENPVGVTTVTNGLGQVTEYKHYQGLIFSTKNISAGNLTELQSWYVYDDDTPKVFNAANATLIAADAGDVANRCLARSENRVGMVTEYAYQDGTPFISSLTQSGANLTGNSSITERLTTMTWNTTLGLVTEIQGPTTRTVYAYGTNSTARLPVSITEYNGDDQILLRKNFAYTSVTANNTTIHGLVSGAYIGDNTGQGRLTTYAYNSTAGNFLGCRTQAARWIDLQPEDPGEWPTSTSSSALVDAQSYEYQNSSVNITTISTGGYKVKENIHFQHRLKERAEYANTTAPTPTFLHRWKYNIDLVLSHNVTSGNNTFFSESNYYDTGRRLLYTDFRRSGANGGGDGVALTSAPNDFRKTEYEYDVYNNLKKVTDGMHNERTFSYDGANYKTGEIFSEGNTTLASLTYAPWANGQILDTTNNLAAGNADSYGSTATAHRLYTLLGDVRQQSDFAGLTTVYEYDADRRLTREALPNESHWDYDHHNLAVDGSGLRRVTRTFSPADGQSLDAELVEERYYDCWGTLRKLVNAAGAEFTYTYDGVGRLTGTTSSVGGENTTIAYDAANNKTTVTDAASNVVETVTDAFGRVRTQTIKQGNTTVDLTTTDYDDQARSITVTRGNPSDATSFPTKTRTFIDADGQPVLVQRYTAGNTTLTIRYDYDILGRLATVTEPDPDGSGTRSLTHVRDGLGRVKSTTFTADSRKLAFTYDGVGGMVSRKMMPDGNDSDPANLLWTATYDKSGRILTESLAQGEATTRAVTYSYLVAGAGIGQLNVTTQTSRGLKLTYGGYDALGRPRAITTADVGNTTGIAHLTQNLTYHALGGVANLTQSYTSDFPASVIANTYDGLGRLLSQAVTLGGSAHSTWQQRFDNTGRRDRLYRATANDSYAFVHDAAGRLTQVSEAFTGLASQDYHFDYASSGQLKARTNPFRTQTVGGRDQRGLPNGNITTTRVTDSSPVTALTESAFSWRADDSLASGTVDRAGQSPSEWDVVLGYDSKLRLESETHTPAGEGSGNWSANYTFAPAGWDTRASANFTGLASPFSLGWMSDFTGGTFARVTADVKIYSEDPPDPGYGRNVTITGEAPAAYGVRLSYARNGGPAQVVPAANVSLVSGNYSATVFLPPGNYTLTAQALSGYAYAAGSATRNFVVLDNFSWVFTYDGGGYPTQRVNAGEGRTETFTWDAFGRLLRAEMLDAGDDGTRADYAYDGAGRLLRATQAAVDGGEPGEGRSVWSEYDPAVEFLEITLRAQGTGGNVTAWKVYGPDANGIYGGLQGTGGLEAVVTSEGNHTYRAGVLHDAFGQPQGRVGIADGGSPSFAWLAGAGRLSAWGATPGLAAQPVVAADATAATLPAALVEAAAWRGRRVDATGRVWLGARWYAPADGRFLSPDPLGHAASWDLYSFAGGDPWNHFDPDGRDYRRGDPVGTDPMEELRWYWSTFRGAHDAAVDGLIGFVRQGGESMAGTYLMLRHPVETGEALGAAYFQYLDNPGDFLLAMELQLRETASTSEGQGRLTFEATALAASFFAPGAQAELANGLGKLPWMQRLSQARFVQQLNRLNNFTRPVAAESRLAPFMQCFPAGTLVLMADGAAKPIEEINEGDEVWADDPADNTPASARKVTHLLQNWTQRLIHVAADEDGDGKADGEIKSTGEHPFWTSNRGWIAAKDLKPGDVLQSADGAAPTVVSAESVPTTTDTFNLSVDGTHTFFAFAGDIAVLVHNAEPISLFEVRPYADFAKFPGDNLVGHEMLQSAWLRNNGYAAFRGANPSLALQTSFHIDPVNRLQAGAGLWLEAGTKGQSAYNNIRANIRVLESAGVPRDVIARQAWAAKSFANSLPCL